MKTCASLSCTVCFLLNSCSKTAHSFVLIVAVVFSSKYEEKWRPKCHDLDLDDVRVASHLQGRSEETLGALDDSLITR